MLQTVTLRVYHPHLYDYNRLIIATSEFSGAVVPFVLKQRALGLTGIRSSGLEAQQ